MGVCIYHINKGYMYMYRYMGGYVFGYLLWFPSKRGIKRSRTDQHPKRDRAEHVGTHRSNERRGCDPSIRVAACASNYRARGGHGGKRGAVSDRCPLLILYHLFVIHLCDLFVCVCVCEQFRYLLRYSEAFRGFQRPPTATRDVA